jgi:hypothetical protein
LGVSLLISAGYSPLEPTPTKKGVNLNHNKRINKMLNKNKQCEHKLTFKHSKSDTTYAVIKSGCRNVVGYVLVK